VCIHSPFPSFIPFRLRELEIANSRTPRMPIAPTARLGGSSAATFDRSKCFA